MFRPSSAIRAGFAFSSRGHLPVFRARRSAQVLHFLENQPVRGGGKLYVLAQDAVIAWCDLGKLAHAQSFGQRGRPVTHPLEAADHASHGFPQASHFTVAAFKNGDLEPLVSRRAVSGHPLNVAETRRAVFQQYAFTKLFQLFVTDQAADAAYVFTVNQVGGMHQRIGQFTISGQQQQAGGIDVQATDRNPARFRNPGQMVENRWPSVRI